MSELSDIAGILGFPPPAAATRGRLLNSTAFRRQRSMAFGEAARLLSPSARCVFVVSGGANGAASFNELFLRYSLSVYFPPPLRAG